MTNSKTTKRALLSSVLALFMCVTMLIGTTFAWFTDTASTAVNKIQAGTLDVALEMWDGEKWVNAEGETLNFKAADNRSEILWEPGCTYELPQLRIVNKGNLALKYKVQITGINGDAKLNEAIDWYYSIELSSAIPGATGWTSLSDAYKLENFGDENYLFTEGVAQDGRTDSSVFKIVGHMKEEAGNEYQGLSIDGIAITVLATQYTYETDSIDNQYDKDATYPDGTPVAEGVMLTSDGTYQISSVAGLKWFADQVNSQNNTFVNKTVELTADIDLAGNAWTPVGNDGGTIFAGTFDGNGHTIKNLTVTDSRTTADDSTNAQYDGVGFFGWLNGYVNDVKFENASVSGYHNVGVLAGYQQFGQIKGVTVENSTVTGTHIGANLCGDKVGGLVGVSYNVNYNNVSATYVDVINCKVNNTTVKGGRDTGKIAGAATELTGKFAGCDATGTTLGATSGCSGANMGAQLSGLVGRDI